MSDFELFSAIMMVLAIVVKLLISLINAKKQPPQTKVSGYFVAPIRSAVHRQHLFLNKFQHCKRGLSRKLQCARLFLSLRFLPPTDGNEMVFMDCVTCNFQQFFIYDMNEVRPEEKPIEILLVEAGRIQGIRYYGLLPGRVHAHKQYKKEE